MQITYLKYDLVSFDICIYPCIHHHYQVNKWFLLSPSVLLSHCSSPFLPMSPNLFPHKFLYWLYMNWLTHKGERNLMTQVWYAIFTFSKGVKMTFSQKECVQLPLPWSCTISLYLEDYSACIKQKSCFSYWYIKWHKSLVPWESMQFVMPIIFMLSNPSLLIRSIIIRQKA